MRREELEHLLRAASAIAERRDVLVLGSQAILGTFDEDALPEASDASLSPGHPCQALRPRDVLILPVLQD